MKPKINSLVENLLEGWSEDGESGATKAIGDYTAYVGIVHAGRRIGVSAEIYARGDEVGHDDPVWENSITADSSGGEAYDKVNNLSELINDGQYEDVFNSLGGGSASDSLSRRKPRVNKKKHAETVLKRIPGIEFAGWGENNPFYILRDEALENYKGTGAVAGLDPEGKGIAYFSVQNDGGVHVHGYWVKGGYEWGTLLSPSELDGLIAQR